MTRNTFFALMTMVIGVSLAALSSQAIAAGDPFIGTFAMDAAKSTADPGPLPTSSTLTTEDAGEGKVKTTGDTELADGTTMHWEVTYLRDGTPAPMTGNPNVDTVSAKQVDPNTLEISEMKEGKVVNSLTVKVSADGTTMTSTITGTTPEGQPFKNVVLSERQ